MIAITPGVTPRSSITESDGRSLRNGEDGWLERDIVEGVCDALLCQFKGRIEARRWMRKTTFLEMTGNIQNGELVLNLGRRGGGNYSG